MSVDKYPSIFSRQMKAIVYLSCHFQSLNTPLMLLREVTIIHIMILDTEMEVTRAITTTPTRGKCLSAI